MGFIITDAPSEPTKRRGFTIDDATEDPSSNTAVLANAMWKGAAAIPDTVLNAPQNLVNLGRAAIGTVTNAIGRPDISPDVVPTMDIARRGAEYVGLINPRITPQGDAQRAIDVLGQGAIAGALTGGGGLARTIIGAGMGATSAGAGAATDAVTGQPALAAIAGAAAPVAAGRAMSRSPKLSPDVELLNREGVSMTPGQIRGGALKRIEDGAASFPILGDVIKGAQRRGNDTFTVAAVNRSLAPIGEKLPPGLTGSKAIEHAYGKLGDAYDSLLPNLKGDLNAGPRTQNALTTQGQQPASSFKTELDNIRAMGNNLPDAQRSQLNAIIDREVIGQFTKSGLASGESLKKIESLLNTLSKKKALSDNYHENELGLGIQEVQAAMRRMVNNVNPRYEGELAKINEGYANFKRVQDAASSVAAQHGVFTPSQLHRAVKSGDRSKDKARFAEENALMQDLSAAGKNVLPSTVPDSGTPYRAALMSAIANPGKAALLGIPLSVGALPYTGTGGRVFQSLMTRQGDPRYSEVAGRASPFANSVALDALMRERQ